MKNRRMKPFQDLSYLCLLLGVDVSLRGIFLLEYKGKCGLVLRIQLCFSFQTHMHMKISNLGEHSLTPLTGTLVNPIRTQEKGKTVMV